MVSEPIWEYMSIHQLSDRLTQIRSRRTCSSPMVRRPLFCNLANQFLTEPGVYNEGEFGIRIEDIIQSIDAPETRFDFEGDGALQFRPITLAPLQQKMIDVNLLDQDEINWINAYHRKVLTEVGDLLREQGHQKVYDWLLIQTLPITK